MSDRDADAAGVQRRLGQRAHAREFVVGRAALRLRSRPITAARSALWPASGATFGPEREAGEMREIRPRRIPHDRVGEPAAHQRRGQVLDPQEDVGEILRLAGGDGQAAVAHHHRGHAVADRLRQPRRDLHLDVVVGVDVDEARRDPGPETSRRSRAGASMRGAMRAMRPAAMPMSARRGGAPVPSKTRPPSRTRSSMRVSRPRGQRGRRRSRQHQQRRRAAVRPPRRSTSCCCA